MDAAFHFKPFLGKAYSEKLQSPDGEVYIIKCMICPHDLHNWRECTNCQVQTNKQPIGIYEPQHLIIRNSTPSISLNVILDWKTKSNKFIRMIVYNTPAQQMGDPYRSNPASRSGIGDRNTDTDVTHITTKEKRVFVNDATSATLRFSSVSIDKFDLRIVVHVIPLVPLRECLSPNHQDSQLPALTRRDPVLEKKFEQLSTDMINLLHTGNLSDVVLTDGLKEIQAHKVVLSARSSVFAKMLLHPMKESREKRITVEDTSIEVLRELLHFMYSGAAEIKDSKMAKELYVAADKYDVQDLRGICSDFLKSIDFNNVLDTLLLADLYSDKSLKEAALNFINRNYSQLKCQKCFKEFMKAHQSIAIEILSFVIDKKTETFKITDDDDDDDYALFS